MKFLHTSDLQLDAPFAFLGEGGLHHRAQLRETFAEIIRLTKIEGCQMLLIAGDLFNSNRPLQATVDFVLSMLATISIPVCILPGNHDCYDVASIYRKVSFPSNVTIFTDTLSQKVFPELNLTVYGKAILSRDPSECPMEGIRPRENTRWHVAMAHGNLVVGSMKTNARPIHPEEIASSGMDYVALGDWHSYSECSQGKVCACYCGAPEPIAFDQVGAGHVASVLLQEQGVEVNPIRVGRIQAERIEIDVSGLPTAHILERILGKAGPEKMLEVVLTGILPIGNLIDTEQFEDLIRSHVYALRMCDHSYPQIDKMHVAEFPSEHVMGRLIDIMQGYIVAAKDDRSKIIATQALQLGVALLQGKDVL